MAKNPTVDARQVVNPWHPADSGLLRGKSGWGMGDNEALAYPAAVTLGYCRVNDKYKDFAYCFHSLKKIKTVTQSILWNGGSFKIYT